MLFNNHTQVIGKGEIYSDNNRINKESGRKRMVGDTYRGQGWSYIVSGTGEERTEHTAHRDHSLPAVIHDLKGERDGKVGRSRTPRLNPRDPTIHATSQHPPRQQSTSFEKSGGRLVFQPTANNNNNDLITPY